MRSEYCQEHGRTYFYTCPDCEEGRKAKDIEREERELRWKRLVEETIWLPEVNDPTLLEVKMLLADFIHKVNMQYDYDRHNCAHFAQDIQLAASTRGIRCGYVAIRFEHSEIGHAIVAFETDYGLKLFEPQNGSEEDVRVGHSYSGRAGGLSGSSIISGLEIMWNDGTRTVVD